MTKQSEPSTELYIWIYFIADVNENCGLCGDAGGVQFGTIRYNTSAVSGRYPVGTEVTWLLWNYFWTNDKNLSTIRKVEWGTSSMWSM